MIIQGAGVAIADALRVAALHALPVGGQSLCPLAARAAGSIPGPVTLEVELVSRSDGVFELEDMNSHLVVAGQDDRHGATAVVRHRGLTILLTSKRLPPLDLGQWRSQGINPEKLSMIGIKAAVGHRGPMTRSPRRNSRSIRGGPCASDLTQLPYKRLRRPVFPLDFA